MKWESIEKRKLTWSELWGMEVNRLSFIIRATSCLHQQIYTSGLEKTLHAICAKLLQDSSISWVSYKTSLKHGRYTWQHNQVLQHLAAELESKRVSINIKSINSISRTFIRAGEKPKPKHTSPDFGQLNEARDWEMQVDLERRFIFPPENVTTILRPELVFWSNSCQHIYIIKLTVPWEDAVDKTYKNKRLRNTNLAVEAEGRGWTVKLRWDAGAM